MKKIVNICLFLAAAATFTACSDDNTGSEYTRENTVSVVSTDLSFDANAHTGGVKFNAPAGAVATVNQPWATAELKGDSVVVSVKNNPALESRAAMLTIKSGADSTNVPIAQEGCQFAYNGQKEYIFNDDAQTLVLPYSKVGAEPTVTSSNAALTATDADTAFVVSLPANTTGEMQQDSFYVNNDGIIDTVIVKRGELKDFVGKTLYLCGYDLMLDPTATSLDQLQIQYEGSIKQTSKGLYLYVPDAYVKLPLTFDASTLSFAFTGGNLMGGVQDPNTGTTYYLFNSIWDINIYQFFEELTYENYMAHENKEMTDDDYQKFQKQMPGIFQLFESNKLSMMFPMTIDAESGLTYGLLQDTGTNDFMAKAMAQYMGYTSSTFDANMLDIDENTYSQKDGLQFEQPLEMIYKPQVIFAPASQAKRIRQMMQKRASLSPSLLQRQAVMNKALKMKKALKKSKGLKWNQTLKLKK